MDVVFSAMQLSTNPLIVSFLERYYNYTEKEREAVPLEAFALSFEMDPEALLGVILVALREYSVAVVRVLAITSHPDVVAKRIEYAMLPDGEKDRKALDQAMGLLPAPRGPTIITRVSVNSGDRKELEEGEKEEPEEADIDFLFPTLSETQKRIPGQIPPARRIGSGETKGEE